jgi:hypothetical protein
MGLVSNILITLRREGVKKLSLVVLMCAFASVAAVAQEAGTVATRGKLLRAADGARIGAVYRVSGDGSAEVIVEGKLVVIPVATLSVVDGKLTTSLTKQEITAIH